MSRFAENHMTQPSSILKNGKGAIDVIIKGELEESKKTLLIMITDKFDQDKLTKHILFVINLLHLWLQRLARITDH